MTEDNNIGKVFPIDSIKSLYSNCFVGLLNYNIKNATARLMCVCYDEKDKIMNTVRFRMHNIDLMWLAIA